MFFSPLQMIYSGWQVKKCYRGQWLFWYPRDTQRSSRPSFTDFPDRNTSEQASRLEALKDTINLTRDLKCSAHHTFTLEPFRCVFFFSSKLFGQEKVAYAPSRRISQCGITGKRSDLTIRKHFYGSPGYVHREPFSAFWRKQVKPNSKSWNLFLKYRRVTCSSPSMLWFMAFWSTKGTWKLICAPYAIEL